MRLLKPRYRILHAPRGGTLRYVLQERSLATWMFWTDVQGFEWVGWCDTLEEAQRLRDRFVQEDRAMAAKPRVVG